MKKISLDEIKKIELDMICYLHSICEKNNLRYFLVGGSLLGAVRHNGFIPWDDDIDIGMPRQDFMKLKEIIKQDDNTIYKISFYDTEKQYGYSIPKLLDTRTKLIDYKEGFGKEESAVFVDIFIFDGMGNTKVSANIWYWFLKLFKKCVFLSRRNFKMETKIKTIIFAIPWLFCHIIGAYNFNVIFNKLSSLKNFDDYEFLATASGVYGKREIFHKEVFSDVTKHSFESLELYIPQKFDIYLNSLYGDYMKLPPIEKRVTNHKSEEWWI